MRESTWLEGCGAMEYRGRNPKSEGGQQGGKREEIRSENGLNTTVKEYTVSHPRSVGSHERMFNRVTGFYLHFRQICLKAVWRWIWGPGWIQGGSPVRNQTATYSIWEQRRWKHNDETVPGWCLSEQHPRASCLAGSLIHGCKHPSEQQCQWLFSPFPFPPRSPFH